MRKDNSGGYYRASQSTTPYLINAGDVAIDASAFLTAGTAPATPMWAGVAPYSASNFVVADLN